MKSRAKESAQQNAASKTIADFTQAVEDLVSGRKKSQELEGTITDAKAVLHQWKIRDPSGHRRPMFDDDAHPRTLLLGALVVALRSDHQLVERLRIRFPDHLEYLASKCSFAEVEAIASAWAGAQPLPKAWQKYERDHRRRWHRNFFRSIEYQFGGRFEANFRKRNVLLAESNPPAYETMLAKSQDCLDDIFAGKTVNMQRLGELFWMDRHRLAKPLRGYESRRYTYLAITRSMDFFLKQKPRIRRKRTTPGRPRWEPWLNDSDLRLHVLRGIEARINSGSVRTDVASAFLAVIHRHLQESGKK